MTRLLIVDDHPLFREAMRSALQLVDADADIFEATSIEGAIDVIAAQDGFDLALLDLSLPGTTGFSGLARVRTTYPRLPVVIVSGHEDADLVRQAISLGVAGYIPKSTSKKELAFAIGEVLKGSIYLPPQYASVTRASEPETNVQQVLKRLKTLTPQQILVLDMIREGLQNKQIAHELRIAETTVKAHVSEILRKLQVYTRTQAVIDVAKVDFSAFVIRDGKARRGVSLDDSPEKIGHQRS